MAVAERILRRARNIDPQAAEQMEEASSVPFSEQTLADDPTAAIREAAGPPRSSAPIHLGGQPFAEVVSLPSLSSPEEAARLATLLQKRGPNSENPIPEEEYSRLLATLRKYAQENPQAAAAPQVAPPVQAPPDIAALTNQSMSGFVRGVAAKQGVGLMSALGAIANSSVANTVAGARGAAHVLLNSPKAVGSILSGRPITPEAAEQLSEATLDANAVMDKWSEELTFVTPTHEGQQMLDKVIAPIMAADDAVNWFAEKASGGNPAAATLIYSGIMGAFEITGLGGAAKLKSTKKLDAAKKTLSELKIAPITQTMPGAIVESARQMAPTTRAANAGQLQTAVRDAHVATQQRLEVLRRDVQNRPAYLNTNDAREFGSEFRTRATEDGFDLRRMPVVASLLNDIENIPGKVYRPEAVDMPPVADVPAQGQLGLDTPQAAGPAIANQQRQIGGQQFIPGERGTRQPGDAATRKTDTEGATIEQRKTHLQHWITIRNRIEKAKLGMKDQPGIDPTVNEKAVLDRLQKTMDRALEKQFHTDMIDGTPEALQAWKDYDAARQSFVKNFNEDTALAQLIHMDASPEKIKRWVIGANAVNASPQMELTVKRLKEVLGEDHPAIEGIRQDYIFDVIEPLMADKPNFQKFIDNVDNVLRNQKPVTDALGLDMDQLRALRNMAKVSKNNPPSIPVVLIQDWSKALARISPVAHGISKAGFKVTLLSNVLKKMAGETPNSQRNILAEFAGHHYGQPVFNKKGLIAGRIMEGAVYADLSGLSSEELEQDE